MKKFLALIILIVCSMMGTACSCSKDPSISFVHGNISINIGEYYTIEEDDVKIENSESGYEIVVVNEEIASVVGNTIRAKKKGVTIIRFQLIDNNSISCDIELVVTNIVYASDISVEKESVQINMRQSTTETNRIFLNDGCTEIPQVTYDETIISYDYLTGKIEALKEGQTSVVVLFEGCNVSFEVRVVDIAYTKQLVVEDAIVFLGITGTFDFQVFPYYANTYNFFTTSNLIRVESNGKYETLGLGIATIYYEYVKAENETPILGSFTITIIDKIESFELNIIDIETGSTAQVCLKEEVYRLKITGLDGIPMGLISVTGNIVCKEFVEAQNALYLDFSFKEKGENVISVVVEMGNEVIEEKHSEHVYTLQDMQIKAKWFAIVQDLSSDGKYHLYLNGDSLQPNSLEFVCVIGSVVVYENLKVYDTTGGTKVDTSHYFEPTEVGEYTFEFEVLGMNLGKIVVVVE